MNDTSIGAAPREQDPAPARKERHGAVPSLFDASRFERALRQRGGDRGDERDGDDHAGHVDAVVPLPAMPTARPPIDASGSHDRPAAQRGSRRDGMVEAAAGRATEAMAEPTAVATSPDTPPPPRSDLVSPRDPAGAVTAPSPTLHALAHAGTAARVDGQWRFEIDPQPLQQGLTLHAERLPSNLQGMPVGGAPAWSLQLHMPVALASSASAAGRDRLEQRLRRNGIALHGLELHARQHGEEDGDDE